MIKQLLTTAFLALLLAGCQPAKSNAGTVPTDTASSTIENGGVDAANMETGTDKPCPKEPFFQVGEVTVWKIPGKDAFFFEAGMRIDADGAPDAYHPDDIGTDWLANAGRPGHWWALATDNGRMDGNPVIQGPDDPNPGYYVSKTTLEDLTKEPGDPRRYVNSNEIPYFVLPPGSGGGAKPGDFGVVINLKNQKMSFAIYADKGPRNQIGEGSIALAKALGIPSDPKRGGTSDGVWYLVFPNSGNRKPRTLAEINGHGQRLFDAWDGKTQWKACLENQGR